MEFDTYRDEAANHLEDAGIAYSRAMDDQLWSLFNKGTKPWDVPKYFPTLAV